MVSQKLWSNNLAKIIANYLSLTIESAGRGTHIVTVLVSQSVSQSHFPLLYNNNPLLCKFIRLNFTSSLFRSSCLAKHRNYKSLSPTNGFLKSYTPCRSYLCSCHRCSSTQPSFSCHRYLSFLHRWMCYSGHCSRISFFSQDLSVLSSSVFHTHIIVFFSSSALCSKILCFHFLDS